MATEKAKKTITNRRTDVPICRIIRQAMGGQFSAADKTVSVVLKEVCREILEVKLLTRRPA